MSEKHKGNKKHTEETKKKMSESRKKYFMNRKLGQTNA
jgi:hypothetical protein